jgi:hypothetical protein
MEAMAMTIELQTLKRLPAPCVHGDPDALLTRGGTAFTVLVDFARQYAPGSRSLDELESEWQDHALATRLIAKEQRHQDPARRRMASKVALSPEKVGGKCHVDILIERGGIRNKLTGADQARVKQVAAAILTAHGRPANSTARLRLHLGAGYYLREVELIA